MTLREKFKDVLINPIWQMTMIDKQMQITDEFAIGFAEWLGKGMTCRLNNGNWIYNMELKASTTEELLERYKKEKGL
jgi:hypothetical protein